MSRQRFTLTLLGYAVLLYLWILLPIHVATPSREFDLPNLLWLVHLITLYIHEAGHFFFRFLGDTMYLLGGSIMQVMVPAVWVIVALRERSRLAPVAAFFTSVSLVDLSIYVKDAERRLLPLIGGRSSRHDWGSVLGRADMLHWGEPLGQLFFFAGLLGGLGAIVWGVVLTAREYRGHDSKDPRGRATSALP